MTFATNRFLIVIGLGVIFIIGGLVFWLNPSEPEVDTIPEPVIEEEVEPEVTVPKVESIGTSVENRNIEVYTYGTGEKTLVFVGGMHGGYEWNSVLVAYEFIDELENGTFTVPEEFTLKIIPALNPDGLFKVVQKEGRFLATDIPPNDAHQTGAGRFNSHNVDLNRNFACKWQPESTWRGKTVSAGTSAFSEPESLALKNLIEKTNPLAVVFWHSQANNVYASECLNGVLPKTLEIMNAYAKAGGYGAVASFDAYPVTGDAEGWLASINIPAITVELEGRTTPEWTRNRAGIEAVIKSFSSSN
ncbi:MAG: M14 family zinc carboxypeptidase [Candidatus Paceibacterota bacterium]